MTSDFTQQYVDAPLNIFGSTLAGVYGEPLTLPRLRYRPVPQDLRGKIVLWEFTLDDFRGQQVQFDKFERSSASWSASTADGRFRGYLISPQATSREAQSFGGTAGNGPVVFCDSYNSSYQTIIAQGSTANRCLATTTQIPQPSYVTYNPGSAITCLMQGPVNSTQYVLIGRTSATIDLHSTLGTSAATMHADLSPTWGGALSPTNATTPGTPTWIFYANGGIRTLASNVATGTQPTATMTNVNDGGCVLGFEVLENGPQGNRMYMLVPYQDLSVSAWNTLDTWPSPCRLMSVNEDGLDLQEHPLPLTGIVWARLWQRRVVVSDGARVLAFDGKTATDLNIFGSAARNTSSTFPLVVGIGGDHSALRATVYNVLGPNGVGTGVQDWEYNEASRGWSPVSAFRAGDPNTGTAESYSFVANRTHILYGPTTPYSRWHNFQYQGIFDKDADDVRWDHQFIPPRGINPAVSYTGQSVETSAVHQTPIWIMPGPLAAHPSAITEIDGRQVQITSTSTVKYQVAAMTGSADPTPTFTTPTTVTFDANTGLHARVFRPQNLVPWYRFQALITMANAISTTNAANVVFRGVTFLDDVLRNRNEVEM